MGDGLGVIGIHVLDHAHLGLTGEWVGQGQLIDPVNCAKSADVAMTHRVEYPEVEIVGLVVVRRLREVPIVAPRCGFNRCFVVDPLRLSQIGQAPDGLDIFGFALAHQQRAFRIFLQIVGVLGDSADQNQRSALLVQAIWHHGAEGKAGHRLGERREHPTVFLEQ